MYQDVPAAIKKISIFLNLPVEEDILEKIVKNCGISEMKASSNFGLNHLRQGGYGNWRSSFSVSLSEFFDDVRNLYVFLIYLFLLQIFFF